MKYCGSSPLSPLNEGRSLSWYLGSPMAGSTGSGGMTGITGSGGITGTTGLSGVTGIAGSNTGGIAGGGFGSCGLFGSGSNSGGSKIVSSPSWPELSGKGVLSLFWALFTGVYVLLSKSYTTLISFSCSADLL